MSAEAYLSRCNAICQDFKIRYPVGTIGAMSSHISYLQDEIQKIKDNKKREYEQASSRRANGNIDGLCQELIEEMSWWAEHEAQTEDARDELVSTIRYILKKIEDVELTEAEPDDGSDMAYEVQRDREMGVA